MKFVLQNWHQFKAEYEKQHDRKWDGNKISMSRYNDPNNEVMDGWPTIIMWILLVLGLIFIYLK